MTRNDKEHATMSDSSSIAGQPARRGLPGGATPAQSCVGLVTGVTGRSFCIRSGGLEAAGRRAASCLLEPVAGDTVACLLVAPDELWVVAVLQREEGAAHLLRSEAPLKVEAPALSFETTRFELRAARAEMVAGEAEFSGSRLRVVAGAIKLVGAALNSVFDRVTHFSKHHLRTTQGIDRVQATHLEIEADQLLRLSGEHALINGDKLVKTRGGQIHFG
jgi:hypothetical protein